MCLFPRKGFPCGQCVECLSDRRNSWSIRLKREAEFWRSYGCNVWMILLTYDEDHVPRTSKGNMTLRKRDVQLFLKRLRKDLQPQGIFVRMFYCGEYGPTTLRPHYHMLLFGVPQSFTKKQVKNVLQKHWHAGFVGRDLGLCKDGGVHYSTKYMINKIIKLPNDEEIEKPFNGMSKGLGVSFLFDVCIDEKGLHRADKRTEVFQQLNNNFGVWTTDVYDYWKDVVSTLPPESREAIEFAQYLHSVMHDTIKVEGYRYRLPRYYRERIFNDYERQMLNWSNYVLFYLPKERKYHEKYDEYDQTHEISMRSQMAMAKERRLISKYIKDSKKKNRI